MSPCINVIMYQCVSAIVQQVSVLLLSHGVTLYQCHCGSVCYPVSVLCICMLTSINVVVCQYCCQYSVSVLLLFFNPCVSALQCDGVYLCVFYSMCQHVPMCPCDSNISSRPHVSQCVSMFFCNRVYLSPVYVLKVYFRVFPVLFQPTRVKCASLLYQQFFLFSPVHS